MAQVSGMAAKTVPIAGPSSTGISKKGVEILRRAGLVARPRQPINPRKVYREGLQDAHTLAIRWCDPYIFWWLKKDLRENYQAAVKVNSTNTSPSSMATGTLQLEQFQREVIEALGLQDNLGNLKQSADLHGFRAFKDSSSLIKKAVNGDRAANQTVLQQTYSRKGRLRFEVIKLFFKSLHRRYPHIKPSEFKYHLYKAFADRPLPDKFSGLLADFTRKENEGAAYVEIPPSKVFATMTDELKRNRLRRSQNDLRKDFEATVSRWFTEAQTPLGLDIVRQIQRRIEAQSSWTSVEEAGWQVKGQARTKAKKHLKIGPYHPASDDFRRARRRLLKGLLNGMPVVTESNHTQEPAVQPTPSTIWPGPLNRAGKPSLWGSHSRFTHDSIVDIIPRLLQQRIQENNDLLSRSPSSDGTVPADGRSSPSSPSTLTPTTTKLKMYVSPFSLLSRPFRSSHMTIPPSFGLLLLPPPPPSSGSSSAASVQIQLQPPSQDADGGASPSPSHNHSPNYAIALQSWKNVQKQNVACLTDPVEVEVLREFLGDIVGPRVDLDPKASRRGRDTGEDTTNGMELRD